MEAGNEGERPIASNLKERPAPDGGPASYTYDALIRLQTLTNVAQSQQYTFGYDDLSRRMSLARPNQVNTGYGYDDLSHLLNVTHQRGVTTLDGTTYNYDDSVGNHTGYRQSKTDLPGGVVSNYSYDPLYQLLQATQPPTTTETYIYDSVSNRLSSLGVSPYVYDNYSNHLLSIPPNVSWTYDNNGNTRTKAVGTDTTTYNWDFENRLTSIVLPGSGGTVSFKYDPFGRRVQKNSSAGITNYLYDGDNTLEELDSIGPTLVAEYTQGLGIDEPLAALRLGATSFYEADGLGSITSLSDSTGAIVATYTYDSYGKLTASTSTVVNPFRYTARESDTETGLYYYRTRYYDPAVGRFLKEDPLRFGAGNNFYTYVFNNPLNAIDPSGLETKVIIVYDPMLGMKVGSHSAVYVDNGGEPILYDPAGGFTTARRCGTGDACSDFDADVQAFKKFHESVGSSVKIFTFETTKEEEAQIATNIEKRGGVRPFFCTRAVTDVLSGVGPFKKLKPTFFPGSLADQLSNLQKRR